eukprot:CAMPEP_0116843768 /NCGR_PEP_ID=MMETSP0418-20121206/12278_1 /TAXON_ID=1158023 /ORGANISM="Astrosyne radiata, Strain 13vi08-1A" /LENGTH=262 /DNA_ID=CAMNT_0004474571 /DNA_START=90 /DNA_END=878 /DNA_ORIENTATION=-
MAGWALLLMPLFRTCYALSKGGTRKVGLHITIASFALAGIFMEVMSRLFSFGMLSSLRWVANKFELHVWLPTSISGGEIDSLGYKVLEILYKVSSAMLRWVDAFEWMCYVVITLLLYFSVATQYERTTFSMNWVRFGLVVGFLSFLDFISELMRYEKYKFYNHIAIAITIINHLLFVPIWVMWLAFQLPHVQYTMKTSTPKTTTTINNNNNAPPSSHVPTTEMQEFTPDTSNSDSMATPPSLPPQTEGTVAKGEGVSGGEFT